MTDLSGNLNWDLAMRRSLTAASAEEGYFLPLPPVFTTIDTQYLMIGTQSSNAKPTWRLGCWASINLLVSPSSLAMLPAGAEFLRRGCGLGQFTLIEIPLLEPRPYLLKLQIPRWFDQIDLEVWYFNP
jgi:hypothetical protein